MVSVSRIIAVAHLQRKPNGDGKENDGEEARDEDQDPATCSQRAGPFRCKAGHTMRLMQTIAEKIIVIELKSFQKLWTFIVTSAIICPWPRDLLQRFVLLGRVQVPLIEP